MDDRPLARYHNTPQTPRTSPRPGPRTRRGSAAPMQATPESSATRSAPTMSVPAVDCGLAQTLSARRLVSGGAGAPWVHLGHAYAVPRGIRRAKKPSSFVIDGDWPHAVMEPHRGALVAQAIARKLAEAMAERESAPTPSRRGAVSIGRPSPTCSMARSGPTCCRSWTWRVPWVSCSGPTIRSGGSPSQVSQGTKPLPRGKPPGRAVRGAPEVHVYPPQVPRSFAPGFGEWVVCHPAAAR